MNPGIWGPHCWIFLHSITLSYPNYPTFQDKQKTKDFFNNLGDILPCMECRRNYKKNITRCKNCCCYTSGCACHSNRCITNRTNSFTGSDYKYSNWVWTYSVITILIIQNE